MNTIKTEVDELVEVGSWFAKKAKGAHVDWARLDDGDGFLEFMVAADRLSGREEDQHCDEHSELSDIAPARIWDDDLISAASTLARNARLGLIDWEQLDDKDGFSEFLKNATALQVEDQLDEDSVAGSTTSTEEPVIRQKDSQGKFREFVQRLLAAQKHHFLKDRQSFSTATLRTILEHFCNIIADEVSAESCTVHLKLYDPRTELARELYEQRREHLENLAGKYGIDDANLSLFLANRRRWMLSPLTYPYWQFPKGAAHLAAVNRGDNSTRGPWACLQDRSRRHGEQATSRANDPTIAALDHGISKEIVQGNVAKVCNRRDILQTRHYRKLGKADTQVWTNHNWASVFRTYYGIPIRVHSDGEAIGILKVENREDPESGVHAAQIDSLLASTSISALTQTVLGLSEQASKGDARYAVAPGSLFALAYIEQDLVASGIVREQRTGYEQFALPLDKFFFIPFPASDTWEEAAEGKSGKDLSKLRSSQLSTLRPSRERHRPPVQVFFEDVNAERTLCELIAPGTEDSNRYGAVRDFYRGLCAQVDHASGAAGRQYDPKRLSRRVTSFFERAAADYQNDHARGLAIQAKTTRLEFKHPTESEPWPDFFFQVELCPEETTGHKPFVIFLLIPPTPSELDSLKRPLADRSEAYREHNKYWRRQANRRTWIGDLKNEHLYSGEYIRLTESASHKPGRPGRVTDLMLDRWAARTQAFVDALPIAEFTTDDARKLSWAALEIGKLIEREISYRGNRSSEDPMPLTALEFYRIPVSNLSFVDDLRTRRSYCHRIQENVDYHLKKLLVDVGIHQHIDYSSRVKEYRSLLLRLGERYAGYRRGNLAVWLYLLSLSRGQKWQTADPDERSHRSAEQQWSDEDKARLDEFLSALDTFETRVNTAIRELDVRTPHEPSAEGRSLRDVQVAYERRLEHLRLVSRRPILGDLKFDSPPVDWISGEDGQLRQAVTRVLSNLHREGVLPAWEPDLAKKWLDGLCRQEVDSSRAVEVLLSGPLASPSPIGKKESALVKQLEDAILRRYEDFAKCGVSLFLQLVNLQIDKSLSEDSSRSGRPEPQGQDGFGDFYAMCYALRSVLCATPQEIEDTPALVSLKLVFDQYSPEESDSRNGNGDDLQRAWTVLESFIERYSTADFVSLVKQKHFHPRMNSRTSVVVLTLGSIYRRIRTLRNILSQQQSAATLDWELERFDILGCRISCLFKAQLFAAHEETWGRGDPFLRRNQDASCPEDFSRPEQDCLKTRSRMRWLCLRTHVHEGGHNAVQTVALTDPQCFQQGYWESSQPNLLRLQVVLSGLLKHYDKTWWEKYRCLAFRRYKWGKVHEYWNRLALEMEANTPGDPRQIRTAQETALWFGTFLYEGIVDILVFLLEGAGDPLPPIKLTDNEAGPIRSKLIEIMEELLVLCKQGEKYSRHFEQAVLRSDGAESDDLNSPNTEIIYNKMRALLEEHGELWKASQRLLEQEEASEESIKRARSFLKHLKKNLESEQRALLRHRARVLHDIEAEEVERETANALSATLIPVFYLDPETGENGNEDFFGEVQRRLDRLKEADVKKEERGEHLRWCVWQLRQFRRGQKAYLLQLGSPPTPGAKSRETGGLWMRERTEVLSRIKNLVFLYDPKEFCQKHSAVSDETDGAAHDPWGPFQALTAYDLFYYLRSLIPVEIQCRTKLADTIAEQYHDAVYKGRPPAGTEIKIADLDEMGRQVERIDRELEIHYED